LDLLRHETLGFGSDTKHTVMKAAKSVAAKLPRSVQQELQRWLYTAKIKSGKFGHFEPEYGRLSDWVKPGDTVLDVGANVGIYSARLSELVGRDGHVFAFEPIARTFQLLTSNSRLFPYPNITLLNAAASSSSGFVQLQIPKFDSGLEAFTRAGVADSKPDDGHSVYSAFCLQIDSLAIPTKVSFVKIDVEGHEFMVLQGMERILREDKPILVVEGDDPEVVAYLKNLGFESEKISGSENSIFRASN